MYIIFPERIQFKLNSILAISVYKKSLKQRMYPPVVIWRVQVGLSSEKPNTALLLVLCHLFPNTPVMNAQAVPQQLWHKEPKQMEEANGQQCSSSMWLSVDTMCVFSTLGTGKYTPIGNWETFEFGSEAKFCIEYTIYMYWVYKVFI